MPENPNSIDDIRDYYSQPKEVETHRKASKYSDEQVLDFILRLYKVTGTWPMPNDVENEIEFRSHYGICDLSYTETLHAAYLILVTGRKSSAGKYGPADITTTDHWLSNNSVRVRAKSGNVPVEHFHTRFGFSKVNYLTTYHITYAAFRSRSAFVLAVELFYYFQKFLFS